MSFDVQGAAAASAAGNTYSRNVTDSELARALDASQLSFRTEVANVRLSAVAGAANGILPAQRDQMVGSVRSHSSSSSSSPSSAGATVATASVSSSSFSSDAILNELVNCGVVVDRTVLAAPISTSLQMLPPALVDIVAQYAGESLVGGGFVNSSAFTQESEQRISKSLSENRSLLTKENCYVLLHCLQARVLEPRNSSPIAIEIDYILKRNDLLARSFARQYRFPQFISVIAGLSRGLRGGSLAARVLLEYRLENGAAQRHSISEMLEAVRAYHIDMTFRLPNNLEEIMYKRIQASEATLTKEDLLFFATRFSFLHPQSAIVQNSVQLVHRLTQGGCVDLSGASIHELNHLMNAITVCQQNGRRCSNELCAAIESALLRNNASILDVGVGTYNRSHFDAVCQIGYRFVQLHLGSDALFYKMAQSFEHPERPSYTMSGSEEEFRLHAALLERFMLAKASVAAQVTGN